MATIASEYDGEGREGDLEGRWHVFGALMHFFVVRLAAGCHPLPQRTPASLPQPSLCILSFPLHARSIAEIKELYGGLKFGGQMGGAALRLVFFYGEISQGGREQR